ncbi:hypothetical protein IJ531_02865 [bacterium]|nr:hypothetical protein [bacterium]
MDAANKIINHAQAYAPEHQDSINWLMNFRNIAQKYGLLETGGLDTHSENPFLKK